MADTTTDLRETLIDALLDAWKMPQALRSRITREAAGRDVDTLLAALATATNPTNDIHDLVVERLGKAWPNLTEDPVYLDQLAHEALSVRWEAAGQAAAELAQALTRADHAEKAAVRNRETADDLRRQIEQMRHQLAALVGVDPCTEWGDILDSAHQAIGGA